MKKQIIILMLLLMVPVGVMAMSHEDHGKKMDMDHGKEMAMEKGKEMGMDHGEKMGHDMSDMDHGKKMDMDHGKMEHGSGMAMGGDMIMLQDVEVDGVMAAGHLMDVKEKMAEHGMTMTHHIMVGFMNEEGDAVDEGQVAVKVEAPDGSVSKATKMMVMKGQFGADVTLDQKGKYKFMIGTKLADGKKRMFDMHYEN